MESQRGQTLPLTLGGIIALIVFGFFAVNYANQLRWQVRAQNAADAAAQAMLTVQTQQFNQMTATLYASAVEEYRIRHLLNAMVLASHQQGGCTSAASCYNVEQILEAQYDQAVARYSADVLLLHSVTATMNFDNMTVDAQALLKNIKNCTGSLGGDCAFNYGTPIIQKRTDTEVVEMDANQIKHPEPGEQTALTSTTTPPLNTDLFAPMEVEVYACATVPSIVPSFLGWTFPPFKAAARGAATSVMVVEDWLQPGTIPNPIGGEPYQVPEHYLASPISDTTGYDWYDLNFAGNGFVAVDGLGYGFQVNTDEFSVYIGWWNSIPIHPFGGPKTLTAMGCAT